LHLGDLLCCIPAVRAFKNAYPESKLILIGLPWAESFAKRFSHYFDGFIAFPGYPGLPEQGFTPSIFEEFSDQMKAIQFDLLLQMQGTGTIVNPMLKTFGAKTMGGFDPVTDRITASLRLMRYPNHGHEIDRNLALMGFLGIHSSDTGLEFPIDTDDREEFSVLKLPLKPRKYVCIHPGSRGSWRQWPPLYFASIANYCSSLGFDVVLTGIREELQIVRHVSSLMKKPPVIAAGKTSLDSLGILIDESAAVICNCTGVSHIASALNIPAVVISMDGEPWRWAPKNTELQRCVDWTRNPDYQLVFKEVAA
jgi:ADP-heptose:LPS heptosyltransferase